MRAIKDDVHPWFIRAWSKNSSKTFRKSFCNNPQHLFKNRKLIPSGPGALSPPQSQIAAFISSMENGLTRLVATESEITFKFGHTSPGRHSSGSRNLLAKNENTESLTNVGSVIHSPSIVTPCTLLLLEFAFTTP
ncbi:hypothetical protein Hanom_Chr09g00846861 [Helianthus anomalus]